MRTPCAHDSAAWSRRFLNMQFRLQQEMLLSAIDAASGATSLASYFPAVRERAESASAAAGKTDLYFRIGGRIVRMRFAGTSLAPIVVPSIEHLSVSPSVSVDLTIHLWDQHSTDVGVPRPGWNLDRYGPLCQIEEEGQHLIFNPSSRTLHMYDAAAREGYFWVVSPKQLPA